jgi:hypothetical protein
MDLAEKTYRVEKWKRFIEDIYDGDPQKCLEQMESGRNTACQRNMNPLLERLDDDMKLIKDHIVNEEPIEADASNG